MTDQRFLREHHIRRGADFRRAYQKRCSAGDRTLLIFGYGNGLRYARLGLSVSRKVGGAVQRNRWKRLLREAFRLERHGLPVGVDLVVIPRPDVEPTLPALRQSLSTLARTVARKLARAEAAGGASSRRGSPPVQNEKEAHGR